MHFSLIKSVTHFGNGDFMERTTVKKLLWLMVNQGFTKCELWRHSEYLVTHHYKSKTALSHFIAAKKMDILEKRGLSKQDAQKLVLMEGSQKVNKQNKSILGSPLISGTVEELTNHQELWNIPIEHFYFEGIFRRKLIITI